MKSTQRFDHRTTQNTRIGEIEQRFTRGRSKPVAVERKGRAIAGAPRPERAPVAEAPTAPVERRPAPSVNGGGGRAARTRAIELAYKEEWRRQLEADAEAERQEP